MEDKLLLSIPEVMVITGLGRSFLMEKLARNEIGSLKIGRRRLIPRMAIEAYVAGLVKAQIGGVEPTRLLQVEA